MKITKEMIEAAIKKASETGLLPRHLHNEDVVIERERIRVVLQAALEVSRSVGYPPTAKHPARG